jgi:hypothetical protein
MRVEGDFPEISIRIGEVAVIATPKRLGSLLQDMCAGGFGHYAVALATSATPSVIRVMFGDMDNPFVMPASAGIQ